MESVEKEIQSLKKQLTSLEGVKIDVTGLRLMLDKLVTLIEQQPIADKESINKIIKDDESVKQDALDRIIFESVSVSRRLQKGVVFLSSVKFFQNQAIPMYSTVVEFDGEDIVGDNEKTFERIADYLSALSNIDRIRILCALAERDRSAKEIQELSGKRGGSLYHHLNALIKQNLIEKIGNNYSLTENGREIMVIIGLINQQAIFLERSGSDFKSVF
ncbi:MAG: winged helix-turn-helix domain-containing protein [Candidatus Odinarchaeum yellowstonii]|uniref:Winged helix-turn-helix domain-containing protein n=1 Tax=Odinarchaeota yellowstonii (strain LCB_4) TaxID=1841599 RepID=A0AAF0IB69_ODILC|nr:MAG: winged helix-turn-helix domain-containing protein [Candidatus Odinarchaeum yellowstonii]